MDVSEVVIEETYRERRTIKEEPEGFAGNAGDAGESYGDYAEDGDEPWFGNGEDCGREPRFGHGGDCGEEAWSTCGEEARSSRGEEAWRSRGEEARSSRGEETRSSHGEEAWSSHSEDCGEIPRGSRGEEPSSRGEKPRSSHGKESRRSCDGESRGGHNKELGRQGEQAAARYLERIGYEILERNWTCPAGEADIVARDGHELVFIEVKTRTDIMKGFPAEAVDNEKRSRYEKIAAWYLKDYDELDVPLRFDVIGLLVVGPDRAMMRHYVNAFGAGF